MASRRPSGLNATVITAFMALFEIGVSPVCPLRVRVCWAVAVSHSLTVPSKLAEAIRWPSGLNATLLTVPVCPRG